MNKCIKILSIISLYLISAFLPPLAAAHTADLPTGFTNTIVTQGLSFPTAMTQTPDGRFFVLEKGGTIKIIQNGTVLAQPLLSLNVDTQGERGLLGIALDPNFSGNGYIYVYYINKSPIEIHISRFTVSGNSAGGEVILMKSSQTLAIFHQSGTLRVGPDGKLWASVGNNALNANSQDLSNIHGKILRMNLDGSIPTDNPFYNQAGKEGRIWAYGFRNPFRFNFLGSKPILGDVGENSWEEINIIEKGGNYGWSNAEGFCNSCGYINPLYAYAHNGQSSSVTGGIYYPASNAANSFPAPYSNAYYYGDYARGFIHYISFDANGNFVGDNSFDDEAGAVVDLFKASDGSIYYISIADATFNNNTGSLHQISYGAANLPPTIQVDASPKGGVAPLSVQFSSAGSSDPANKPLSYSWEFGDGTPNSTDPNPTHIYTQNGTYTATLTLSNGTKTALASVQIQVGNNAPTATITSPVEQAQYNAGDTISYNATASDIEDGTLPASAYAWYIIFHHDTHVHPFKGPITNATQGSFIIPNTGEPSPTTWYEIRLTVTDSKGLTYTTSRMIKPRVVTITLASAPVPGLTLKIDGIPVQTPYVFQGVVGFERTIDMTTPQNFNGKGYDFLKWSDTGGKSHVVTTPAVDTTYTATFTEFAQGTGHIRFRVKEYDENGQFTGKYLNGVTAKLTDITGTDVHTAATSAPDPITHEDGWVWFSNVDAGTYGVLTYTAGYKGLWRQTDCNGTGTTQNVSVKNNNTEGQIAVLQNAVTVTSTQIAYCKDAGLQKLPAVGNLSFRVYNIARDITQRNGYGITGGINDVTVKLTDTTGATVIKTGVTKIANNEDGWITFTDVPVGTYGITGYKAGYEGFWRQTDCVLTREINVSLQNSNTEGLKAAWNPSVPVTLGTTTYCRDLGLRKIPGDLRLRIREFDASGNFTGKFVNDVTAKLTDTTGTTVYASTMSKTYGNQDGWVVFNDIDTGDYAVIAYKTVMQGLWKQTTCPGAGTTTGATIQNANTENLVAGWQNSLTVTSNTITWCADIGLKNGGKGSIGFRVREFDQGSPYTGKFINGATIKLTSIDGQTVIATASSQTINGEDGWVNIKDVPVDNYDILTYKSGYAGAWKQTTCSGQGTTTNATKQNATTENLVAGWQHTITVAENQTTWCQDVALEKTDAPKVGMIAFRVREFDTSGAQTTNFVNDATITVVNSAGVVVTTTTSKVNGTENGWAVLSTVPVGTYTIYTYKAGLNGFWRQTDCNGTGSTSGVSVNNQYTNGQNAASQPAVPVSANQTTWCQDVGLQIPGSASQATITSPTPVVSTPTPTTIPTNIPTPTISPITNPEGTSSAAVK